MWYDYLVRKFWSYASKNGGVYIVRFFIFPNESNLIGVKEKEEFYSIRLSSVVPKS